MKVSDIWKTNYFKYRKSNLDYKVSCCTSQFPDEKCASQSENYSYCPPSYVDQERRSGIVPTDWRKEASLYVMACSRYRNCAQITIPNQ